MLSYRRLHFLNFHAFKGNLSTAVETQHTMREAWHFKSKEHGMVMFLLVGIPSPVKYPPNKTRVRWEDPFWRSIWGVSIIGGRPQPASDTVSAFAAAMLGSRRSFQSFYKQNSKMLRLVEGKVKSSRHNLKPKFMWNLWYMTYTYIYILSYIIHIQ